MSDTAVEQQLARQQCPRQVCCLVAAKILRWLRPSPIALSRRPWKLLHRQLALLLL
ncbi:MAG: hypothetical protein EBW54_08525, partial [Betaproteobacteria bacterium]|nr:hypothetical protein [Betaproteobacteria bacterium]